MVEYFIGKRTRAAYALENVAYGTANVATNYSWAGIVQSIAPSSKSELMQVNSMDDDDTRNVSDYFETIRTYGASMEFLLQHCRPLMLAWGTDTFNTGSPATHTITEATTLESFSLNFGYQHGTADHAVDYLGCVVNKMDIACTKGEFVKCTAEIVAQDSEDNDFRPYQSGVGLKKYPVTGVGAIIPYAYSDAAITINGVSYEDVQSVRMTINNNLLSEPTLDSANDKRIAEPVPQLREYDASMTVKMATDDLYDIWDGGAYMTDPVVAFARSVNDKVVFTLESAILESAISPLNITEGIVLVELPMKVKKITPVETNSIDVDYSTAEL